MTWTATLYLNGTYSLSADEDDEAGRRCALLSDSQGPTASSKMKLSCAAAMQAIIDEREIVKRVFDRRKRDYGSDLDPKEQRAFDDAMRCYDSALTNIENALMLGLKSLDVRRNAGL